MEINTLPQKSFVRKRSTPPPYVLETETISKAYDPKIAGRYLEYLKPYSAKMIIAILLMGGASIVSVLGPFLVQLALDKGVAAGSMEVLISITILYFVLSLLQWVLTHYRVKIMIRVGQGVVYDLRAHLFEHLQSLSLSFYNRYSVGRVIARVINDVGVARRFITWSLLGILRDVFVLIGIFIAMLLMNVKLSLITFTVLPFMIGATIYFRRRTSDIYRVVRAANSWVNSVLAENINGVRVVQAFSREDHNLMYFKNVVNGYNLRKNLDAQKLMSAFVPIADLLGSIATMLVVWIGGQFVLREELSVGVLVAFILYVENFFGPIRNISQQFDAFQSTMAGGERIFALMDTPVEVQDSPDATDMPVISGLVQFNNVTFRYEDGSGLVLKNVTLEAKPGQTIALVGATGAGKTTIIKLLARFHDPTEGSVLIDGHDLRDIKQNSLRSQMGIVLQDPFLFDGTVNDNIRFGKLDATDTEIIEAAKAVGAHDFIRNLKDGYDTHVQEGGVMLSVGQRQLISFARALLANPRILILDEATSSVDTQTEQVIQKALMTLLQGRTSFVIAHRLSTILNSDDILVMENGEIIEQGKHAELIKRNGTYDRLYKMGFEDQN